MHKLSAELCIYSQIRVQLTKTPFWSGEDIKTIVKAKKAKNNFFLYVFACVCYCLSFFSISSKYLLYGVYEVNSTLKVLDC